MSDQKKKRAPVLKAGTPRKRTSSRRASASVPPPDPRPICRVCGDRVFGEYGLKPAQVGTGVCEHCYDARERLASAVFPEVAPVAATLESAALLAIDAAEVLIRALSIRPFGESTRLDLAAPDPDDTAPAEPHPNGATCADCAHIKRCVALLSYTGTERACDWTPSRFRLRVVAEGPAHV